MVTAIFIGGLIVANIYATGLVLQEESFESSQKAWQVAIIWLVPLIGSLFFIGFIRSERKEAASSRRFDGNPIEHDGYDISSHSSDDN